MVGSQMVFRRQPRWHRNSLAQRPFFLSAPRTSAIFASWSSLPGRVAVSAASSDFCFSFFAVDYLVCFHTNTTFKFCSSFVLIKMQIARGVWGAAIFQLQFSSLQ